MITRYWKPVLLVFVLLLTQVIFPYRFTQASSRAPLVELNVGPASPPTIHSVSGLTEIEPEDFEPGVILLKVRPGVSIHHEQGEVPRSNINDLTEAFREWDVYTAKPLFAGSSAALSAPELLDEHQYAASLELAKWYKLSCPLDADVVSIVSALKKNPAVEWAEPNYALHLTSFYPNDPQYTRQWALPHIGADRAWDNTMGLSSVVIGVIDTGVKLGHPDLASKIWRNLAEVNGTANVDDDGNGYIDDFQGWDWADSDNNPDDSDVGWDYYGHGTHVAGIAAAATNNGIGIAGVCPNCMIMPLRVCSEEGNGCYEDRVGAAVLYAVNAGASVLNMSLGSYVAIRGLDDVITWAWSHGVTVVAGAGNDGIARLHYPAAYDHVIGVSATRDPNDSIWLDSNYGSYIDLAAPGAEIYSTLAGPTSYDFKSGTSMATPFVSGAAALVYSALPADLRPARHEAADRVTHMLQATARDFLMAGKDTQYGWGRIDVYQAVWQTMNPPKVSLRVRLYHGSRINHNALITVKVRHKEFGMLYETTATTNADGWVLNLPIRGLPTGDYDISVKTDRSVSIKLSSVRLTAGATTTLDFSNGWTSYLKAGDFNQDDKVNMFDLVRILRAFQQQDLSFDFDGSGRVTILEVNMVLTGLRNGLVGDDFPYVQEPSQNQAYDTLPRGTGRIELVPIPYYEDYQVGDQLSVYAIVTTLSQAMAGADLIVKYDPCALRVLGITNGSVFESLSQQSDHPELGEIRISGEGEYIGAGTVAVIQFEVIAGNTQTNLSALFRPNRTTESNMVEPDTGTQVLGEAYGVPLDLIGTPARPPITVNVNPPSGGYLTTINNDIAVNVQDACGGIVVESVEFEILHDGIWETTSVDQNKFNGWSTTITTASIQDQPIQLRTTVKDGEGYDKAVTTVNYILDRTAPVPTMTLPSTVPGNRQIWVSWNAVDNLSGVSSYDVQYRIGLTGTWISWLIQTTDTTALLFAEPGQDYYFRTRARDRAGNESRFSDESVVWEHGPGLFLPYIRID